MNTEDRRRESADFTIDDPGSRLGTLRDIKRAQSNEFLIYKDRTNDILAWAMIIVTTIAAIVAAVVSW